MNQKLHPVDNPCYKIALAGDIGVGKTTIIRRFMDLPKNFVDDEKTRENYLKSVPNPQSTIGAAYNTKDVIIGNTNLKLEIWDTAGNEKYQSLMPIYYRQAAAVVLVLDLSNPESFKRIRQLIENIKKEYPNSLIFVLGNKCDIGSNEKIEEELKEMVKQGKIAAFHKISASSCENLGAAFMDLSHMLAEHRELAKPKTMVAVEEPKGSKCCIF